MPIFPGGVSRALAARDDFRRGRMPVSQRSTGMTWGQLEAFLSGELGRYSGLISNARAYTESPWVAPSVHVFAATCAARTFRMFRDTGTEKERILDHELIDLMARPNVHAKLSDYWLKYWTFALYDFDGEVLWHLGRAGKTTEKAAKAKPGKKPAPEFITIFRKTEAQPVRDQRTNEFTGWNLSLDGVQYFADRDDVIHFPRFDPVLATAAFNPFTMRMREPTRGRSSLDSKRRALSADAAMQNFNQEFFVRGIAPNFAFIGPEDLTEPEKENFREKLMARMYGSGKQEPVIMGGQWNIKNLGVSQKDAQFAQGREFARDEILAGRIPPIFVGDRDATYANAQQQVLTWLESIVIPALTHFSATLDSTLLFDEPDVYCDLATDDIYALQVAKKELVTSAIELISKARTPPEVAARTVGLEMENYEGSDVGIGDAMDVPLRDIVGEDVVDQTSTARVGTSITAIVMAVEAGQIPRDSGIGQLVVIFSLTPEEANQVMGSAGMNPQPTPKPQPTPVVEPAQPRFIRLAEDSPAIRVAEEPAPESSAVADIALALRESILFDDAALRKLARRFHVRMASEGAKQTRQLIAPEGPFEAIDFGKHPLAVEFISERSDLVKRINLTTAEQVTAAIESDLGADGIRDIYNARHADAKMIGRLETGAALNGGRYLQMLADGVEGIEWLTGRGDEGCALHSGLDGEVVPLGEKFSNGCRYPHDVAGPVDQVKGCSCSCLPANITGLRSSLMPSEKQRVAYWKSTVVTAATITDRQFRGLLQKMLNEQRGRVLALYAELSQRVASFAERKKKLRSDRNGPTPASSTRY